MIPCLPKSALDLLVGTADERYACSPHYFRATHFPQVLHRYTGDALQKWTEDDLLQDLLQTPMRNNRVYAVLGSTGSGKSELLCWLKDRWEADQTHRPAIRISRTELNPQLLLRKCCETLQFELDVPLDESRWEILLKKPVTLVNQMIWSALSELLHHDEDIVPAAMLFRPTLEKNLTQFAAQIQKGNVQEPPELLSEAQFQTLLESTSLRLAIEYQTFRQVLVQKFDQFLFHGQDLMTWMKRLSSRLREENIRPLLLIDDLVQSINLYASALLDLFLTLEEGNWDVVIGLTPGVLQDSDRGHGLVQRFLTLDTIDDRVTKLWLSDEAGQSFYSLQPNEAVPFLRRYLSELKKTNGFPCSLECPHAGTCASYYEPAENTDLALLPLNAQMVNRLYEGIPVGKGKLRYLIFHLKETIRFFLRGQEKSLERVSTLLRRECFAEHHDPLVKQFAEWFADPLQTEVNVSGALLAHFGRPARSIRVPFRHLHDTCLPTRSLHQPVRDDVTPLRDWVEGKDVNRELLEPIRTGIAALIQDITKATCLSRPFTARQGAALQRTSVEHRTRYPISFERFESSPSSTHEILIQRNSSVFDIAGYQQLRPQERSTAFTALAQDGLVAAWVYAGEGCQKEWIHRLEQGLGMELAVFAFHLREWSLRWKRLADHPWLSSVLSPFQELWMNQVEALFADWFLLRENMADGAKLADLSYDLRFDTWFAEFSVVPVLDEYHLHDKPIGTYLRVHQESLVNYRSRLSHYLLKFRDQLQVWMPLLNSLSPVRAEQAQTILSSQTLLLQDIEIAADLFTWCQENELDTRFVELQHLTEQTRLLKLLANDLGWDEFNLRNWERKLDADTKLRARVKTHLKTLIQNGLSTLPLVQGRGILTDLKTHCPKMYQNLRIQLVTRVKEKVGIK